MWPTVTFAFRGPDDAYLAQVGYKEGFIASDLWEPWDAPLVSGDAPLRWLQARGVNAE